MQKWDCAPSLRLSPSRTVLPAWSHWQLQASPISLAAAIKRCQFQNTKKRRHKCNMVLFLISCNTGHWGQTAKGGTLARASCSEQMGRHSKFMLMFLTAWANSFLLYATRGSTAKNHNEPLHASHSLCSVQLIARCMFAWSFHMQARPIHATISRAEPPPCQRRFSPYTGLESSNDNRIVIFSGLALWSNRWCPTIPAQTKHSMQVSICLGIHALKAKYACFQKRYSFLHGKMRSNKRIIDTVGFSCLKSAP